MTYLKRRKPILALLLSLLTPGLGQIYNGQFRKGVSYLVGFFLVYILFSFLLFTFYGMIFYLMIVIACFLFVLIDSLRTANKLKAITLKPFNKWYIYVIIFLLSNAAIRPLLGWTIKSHIARAYKIPSSGMAPALLVGDRLIADMRSYESQRSQRGDIIIFEFPKDPSKYFIKRVIGMESEKVEIVRNKIYINEKLLDDPWGDFTNAHPGSDTFGPVAVPKGSLFVLGDNRDNSQDSRFFGFVDVEKIRGKALYLYWAKDKSRIGMELK